MSARKKAPKDWRKTDDFKELREEILESLGRTQVVDALTLSRVEEYLDFWVLRHQLQDDIEKRGLYVQDERGRTMENRSVSLSIQTSRQMAAIANALGISGGPSSQGEDDEL